MLFSPCPKCRFWRCLGLCWLALGHAIIFMLKDTSAASVHLAERWDILGPFQIGTREAAWGADPLEQLGGFRSLSPSNRSFASSLGDHGRVHWSRVPLEVLRDEQQETEGRSPDELPKTAGLLRVDFPEIDWSQLQDIYGWPALQWSAWARGSLEIHAEQPQMVVLYSDHVLELEIDGRRYFGGDFYAYRRAPLVLELTPGLHQVNLRLIRDVRAMGGTEPPELAVALQASISSPALHVNREAMLMPEVLPGDVLASIYGSIPVRNDKAQWTVVESIETSNAFQSFTNDHEQEVMRLYASSCQLLPLSLPMMLAPGQTASIRVRLQSCHALPAALSFSISFHEQDSVLMEVSPVITYKFTRRSWTEPHRVTYLHPSGAVSYGLLQAPRLPTPSTAGQQAEYPILLNLHGAGLDVDSDEARSMLDGVSDLPAWVIYPSGLTTWADDWHLWAGADALAAVDAVSAWIKQTGWTKSQVNTSALYALGHSNGGQGVWHMLTHHPDKFLAAAQVSGYASIGTYVPYTFWRDCEPAKKAILDRALSSHRHELLVGSVQGQQIYVQHGSLDDNVPVFHARKMVQLLEEANVSVSYHEVIDAGHWYDGVLRTGFLRDFYQQLGSSEEQASLPTKFRIVVPGTASISSRGDILVGQLQSPDLLGTVEVHRLANQTWLLDTSNVFRLCLKPRRWWNERPTSLLIDGCELDVGTADWNASSCFEHHRGGLWQPLTNDSSQERPGLLRTPRQEGGVEALLQTRGRIRIDYHKEDLLPLAQQTARNLFQYFGAAARIVWDSGADQPARTSGEHHTGNSIRLLLGTDAAVGGSIAAASRGQIHLDARRLCLARSQSTSSRGCYALETGLGMYFVSPLAGDGVEIVVWGYDVRGLEQAVRLLPLLSGTGQPDFVVLSKQCAWKGIDGVLAMGFFDLWWEISAASYLS